MLEVFAAARLRAAAAHLEAAKGLPPHDRAGDAAVDVEIAADQLRLFARSMFTGLRE